MYNIKQEHLRMPYASTLFIFSDMALDVAVGGNGNWKKTNNQVIKQKYAKSGYAMVNINHNLVFWNLSGKAGDCPITCDTRTVGCALMSGFSAQLLGVFDCSRRR
jgi:hypothetical protein